MTDSKSCKNLASVTNLLGRIGLGLIFFLAGLSKLQNYEGSGQYMASVGLPEFLLPLVIAFELIGPVMLVLGYRTCIVALAFAGFSVLSAMLFHFNFGDQMQFIMFFKNIAIAGGFLILAVSGSGACSLDAKRRS